MTNLDHINEKKYYYDEKSANRAVDFIETFCLHTKGDLAGQPFILEEWQKNDIIRPLFGWKSKKTGLRKYRQCFVFIPRKNGKTNLMCGIALYMLFSDGEKGAEIVSAAADKFQARLSFSISKNMVIQSPELAKRANTYRDSITYDRVGSYYKVISADADTKHGLNLSCCLLDEIHSHKNRDLYDVLLTSMGARKEPLMLGITTAGVGDLKNHISKELYNYSKKLIDGVIKDDTFLAVVYEADEEDDIFDEEVWRKANPGYGTIITEEYMKQQALRAKNEPSFVPTFKRLHLNQWVTSEIKWITDSQFMECDGEVNIDELYGKPCFAGLDLASVRDVTCITLLFPQEDGTYDLLLYNFIPEDNAYIRTERDKVDYLRWKEEGYVELTPGDVCDYNYIKHKIRELSSLFDIKMMGYDRWNSSQLVIDVTEEGICPMIPVGQGFRTMSPASKEFETLILSNKIRHGGNPVLRWMMSNVVLKIDPASNIKPDKSKSTEKIDGIISTLIALSEAMQNKNDNDGSAYDDKEIFFI